MPVFEIPIMKILLSALFSVFSFLMLFSSCRGGRNAADDLLFTDSLFSAFSEEYGSNEAFARFAHPDVVLLRQKQKPLAGRQNLLEFLAGNPDTCCNLIWKPDHALASSSKDLGYTWGRYWMISRHFPPDTVRQGYYVTIWRKMPDGSWKFILDTGVEGPEVRGK